MLGAAGVASSVATAPLSCPTGIGCVANATVGALSADAAWAGAKQFVSGQPENTSLNNTLQALGLSPEAASYAEIALGIGAAAKGGSVVGAATSVGAKGGTVAGEAAPGPVNLMGNGDQFFKNAAKRTDIDPNGSFDVIAHGSAQNIEVLTARGPVTVDQRVAGRLIENSPGYTAGQPVRLLSCDTGACDAGFAQNLANKMGVPVQAPTELVWAYGNGSMVVAGSMPF